MMRKLLLSAVIALSFLSPLTWTASTQAATFAMKNRVGKVSHYHVYVRASKFDAWRLHTTTTNHGMAHRIAENFRARGLQAKVVHH
jgi:hypothetical protein